MSFPPLAGIYDVKRDESWKHSPYNRLTTSSSVTLIISLFAEGELPSEMLATTRM